MIAPLASSSLAKRAAIMKPKEIMASAPRTAISRRSSTLPSLRKGTNRDRAAYEHRSDADGQQEARQHLGGDELERRDRRRRQAAQEAALAIAHDDVADAEQAAEHHVHAEDAREQPVHVAHGGAAHRLARRAAGRGLEQELLGEVAFRRVLVDPVARRCAQVQQEVHLVPLDLADRRLEGTGLDATNST